MRNFFTILVLSLILIGFSVQESVQVKDSQQTTRQSISAPPCEDGYFWSTQSCLPCQTVQNGSCTCSSYLGCDTVTCSEGFTSTGTSGAPACTASPSYTCGSGCKSCGVNTAQDSVVCFSCEDSYSLVGSVCLKKNGCTNIDPSTAQCTSCPDGTFFNYDFAFNYDVSETWANYFLAFDSFCTACKDTNCKVCPSYETCTTCKDNFTWTVGTNAVGSCQAGTSAPTCQSKIPFCTTCNSDLTLCTACQTAYYLSSDSKACPECKVSLDGCLTCSNATTCTKCAATHFLSGTKCTTCSITNCQTCKDQTDTNAAAVCQTCKDTFFPDGNLCTSCSNDKTVNGFTSGTVGCQVCSNATSCQTCSSGYFPDSGKCYLKLANCNTNVIVNGKVSCSECSDLFYRVQNQADTDKICSCQKCVDSQETALKNSVRCGSSLDSSSLNTLRAYQCRDSYYLAPTTAGSTSCVAYPTTQTCLTVKDDNASAANCSKCLPGYLQLANSTCAKCDATCSQCSLSSDNTKVVCGGCVTGYYLKVDVCIKCLDHCTSCKDGTTCDACNPTYFWQTPNCSPCSTNCVTCNAEDGCTTCVAKYFNTDKTVTKAAQVCTQCPDECATCKYPGQICDTCKDGFAKTSSGGCVSVSQDNCYTTDSTGSSICKVCNYGFYRSGSGQCLQCINPYSATVCRNNSVDPKSANATNSTNNTTPNNTTSNNANLLSVALLFLIICFSF